MSLDECPNQGGTSDECERGHGTPHKRSTKVGTATFIVYISIQSLPQTEGQVFNLSLTGWEAGPTVVLEAGPTVVLR